MCPYPTDDDLQCRLQQSVDWDAYRTDTMSTTLKHLQTRRQLRHSLKVWRSHLHTYVMPSKFHSHSSSGNDFCVIYNGISSRGCSFTSQSETKRFWLTCSIPKRFFKLTNNYNFSAFLIRIFVSFFVIACTLSIFIGPKKLCMAQLCNGKVNYSIILHRHT